MIVPNMPTPSTNAATEQTAITGCVKKVSGMIGSAAFDSAYSSAPSITAETTNSDTTRVAPQPYCVADDREEDADDHAAGDALQSAEDDQLAHAVDWQERELAGRAAQRGRGDEQHRAEHEERFAAIAVRQAREDRDRHGGRQHVDRREPPVAVESLQPRNDA